LLLSVFSAEVVGSGDSEIEGELLEDGCGVVTLKLTMSKDDFASTTLVVKTNKNTQNIAQKSAFFIGFIHTKNNGLQYA
jgi:hypothetical protein